MLGCGSLPAGALHTCADPLAEDHHHPATQGRTHCLQQSRSTCTICMGQTYEAKECFPRTAPVAAVWA